MARHDAKTAECVVLTFKEGLLSPIAHDLKLRVEKWEVELDPEAPSVEATFDTSSLRVVCAMKDGVESPGTLSADDRAKIESNTRDDVLHSRRHGEARFRSTEVAVDGDAVRIRGQLTLHGQTRDLRVSARRDGDRYVAEVRLHQPDFGIKPFRAALGTLKVQPTVTVRFSIPAG